MYMIANWYQIKHRLVKGYHALDTVSDVRCIGIEGQEKAFRLKDMTNNHHTGAPELLVVVVPVLCDASLSLQPLCRGGSIEHSDVAFLTLLAVPPSSPLLSLPWALALPLPLQSKASNRTENKKAE
ncbi:hypothetical protein Nepgr_031071 [Nepenthes gracilis]|uniref:Uncharacterized protein n=1 Tax=Nepenthes gracilis TaxID=150966 RepID=A0AAD3THS8_NEPGR|nr:hypothetical protein Nepgr_031071 [Nepenthes gracilis]